jgi:membrane fusion protein
VNTQSQNSLFRKEVQKHQHGQLYGDVHLAVPIGWHLIGLTLFLMLVTALIFLATASYNQVETVTGMVAPDRGVVPVVPQGTGMVSTIHVEEGQTIAAGAPLLDVRTEASVRGGGTVAMQVRDALARQDALLASQGAQLQHAATADGARLAAQVAGLERELQSVNSQIVVQRDLIRIAEEALREGRLIADRGFISRRDVEARESLALTRRQQLGQLQQTEARLATELGEARHSIQQSAAAAAAQVSSIGSDRAALAQQLAQADATRGYTLTAPVAGTVTALTARIGQPTAIDRPLLVILPAGTRPLAELYVPTRAAGFIEPGQRVRLAVDAYPYQRFGTLEAVIISVSSATVARPDASGAIVPVYLVTARILNPNVRAFGRDHRLVAGMMLSARITTDRRSLLQWLFEPLLAATS